MTELGEFRAGELQLPRNHITWMVVSVLPPTHYLCEFRQAIDFPPVLIFLIGETRDPLKTFQQKQL